jgi:hypothetical protein
MCVILLKRTEYKKRKFRWYELVMRMTASLLQEHILCDEHGTKGDEEGQESYEKGSINKKRLHKNFH